MIKFKIKKYSDNGEEIFFLVEIIKEDHFNNDIIDINGDYETLLEIYILLKSDNVKEIQEYLSELIQDDDIPTLSQLSQRGVI